MAMRARAAVLSASEMRPRATCRAMLRSISPSALASASALASVMTMSSPASVQTCAMPRPICPAPTIPTRRISGAAAESLTGRSLLAFPELLVELRQHLEEIADQAVIGDLEDRRLLVLVDRD